MLGEAAIHLMLTYLGLEFPCSYASKTLRGVARTRGLWSHRWWRGSAMRRPFGTYQPNLYNMLVLAQGIEP
jgi:hypothetical protein